MQVDFPYHIDRRGGTAETTYEDHIRDLVEAVLFCAQGERPNRPAFGSGLLQLVFSPNSEELATATQFLVQGALQQWLGSLISVTSVKVRSEESTLEVTVEYVIRRTQARKTVVLRREV